MLVVGRIRKVKWRELIFSLHRKELSEAFQLFRNNHPKMSINRCAYNVMKSFYSTTAMKYFRSMVEYTHLTYDEIIQWYHFDRKSGALHA